MIDTENDYDVNYRFGKIISNYCTGVVIVKEKNYSAIFCGLKDAGFNMENVKNVADFSSARMIIAKSKDDSVFLIENDLPDNYR